MLQGYGNTTSCNVKQRRIQDLQPTATLESLGIATVVKKAGDYCFVFLRLIVEIVVTGKVRSKYSSRAEGLKSLDTNESTCVGILFLLKEFIILLT